MRRCWRSPVEIHSPADLDRFFGALAAHVPGSVKVILTGGAAALLMGATRPTGDLDFGVTLIAPRETQERDWTAVEAAIAAASRLTGMTAQYSADIDRWSSITMPNYQRHTRLYQRFGRVRVHLLEPIYWAVPKLARYLDTDAEDIEAVLHAEGVGPEPLARLCGRALRASPRSSAQFSFRQHVEHFFRAHGPAVWGSSFDAEAAVRAFRRAVGIRTG
jgi:hypothetical protein